MTPLLSSPLEPLRVRGGGGGSGLFGPVRRNADGSVKWHYGLDLGGTPGAHVVAPLAGLVVRHGWCYPRDSHYRLIELYAGGWHVELLYLRPIAPTARHVEVGEWIGELLDVSSKYPGMEMDAHLHLQVWRRLDDPATEWADVATAEHKGRRWYDPAPLLGIS
jgi:hypothetical protein